jgi:hypothetical protein
MNFPAHGSRKQYYKSSETDGTNSYGWEMNFNLLQGVTGRKPRSPDHLPIQWSQGLSWLTGSWKVRLLECLHSVILRDGKRHLEAARWHTDLVRKREKQADHIGMMAAAIFARVKDGNEETH